MSASKQHQFLQVVRSLPARSLVPAGAACGMLFASFFPWLNDPLAGLYSAWQLPVDIGWQFRSAIFSYGLLCACCAALAFFTAYVQREPSRAARYFTPGYVSLGFLCMVPFFLFLLQYLFVDVHGIDVLAQHLIQELLVGQHFGYNFGYNIANQLIPLQPFAATTASTPGVTTATFAGRFELLLDLAYPGPFISLACGCLLIGCRRLRALTPSSAVKKRPKPAWFLLMPMACLALAVVLGRAPAAMIFNDLAKSSLAAGDSLTAIKWLDVAHALNPALDQVSYYHIERGQADYALYLENQSEDSRVYLAFVYRGQADNLDAVQELLAIWHAHPASPWVVDELSITLENLAESIINQSNGLPLPSTNNLSQRPGGPPLAGANNLPQQPNATPLPGANNLPQQPSSPPLPGANNLPQQPSSPPLPGANNLPQQPNATPLPSTDTVIAALTWLQMLAQTDASNVYAPYLIGRTQYFLHNYSSCIGQMTKVTQFSQNADIQSSAYTYIGLSLAGEGDSAGERRLLFKAVKLDPYYQNNTAREELSGLH